MNFKRTQILIITIVILLSSVIISAQDNTQATVIDVLRLKNGGDYTEAIELGNTLILADDQSDRNIIKGLFLCW